jgi:hypothetical protein
MSASTILSCMRGALQSGFTVEPCATITNAATGSVFHACNLTTENAETESREI